MEFDSQALIKEINTSLEGKFGQLATKKEVEDTSTKIDELQKKMESIEKENESRMANVESKDWKAVLGKEFNALISGQKTVITLSDLPGTIQTVVIPQIFYVPEDYGAFLQANPLVLPMANAIDMARQHGSTKVSLTWKSAGSGEGIEEGVTEEATVKHSVSRERLIANVPLSNESLKYPTVDMTNYIITRLREEWAKELDKQVFTGNSNPFVGLANTSGLNVVTFDSGKTNFSDIDRKYLVRAIHAVSAKVVGSSFWYMSNSNLGVVHENLVTTTGMPIYDYQTGSLLGYKVLKTDALPLVSDSGADKIFGYFGSSRIGIAYAIDGVSFDISREAEFKKDNTVIRVTADCVLYVILPEAFCVIKTAAE